MDQKNVVQEDVIVHIVIMVGEVIMVEEVNVGIVEGKLAPRGLHAQRIERAPGLERARVFEFGQPFEFGVRAEELRAGHLDAAEAAVVLGIEPSEHPLQPAVSLFGGREGVRQTNAAALDQAQKLLGIVDPLPY